MSEDTNKENAAEEAVTEYKIKVYDTITKTKKDVEVSKDVYNEYRRGEWRIDKNNIKNLKRMIPFSALLSKEGDIDDFDEFIDHSNNPEEIYCEEQEFYNPISCLKESDIELLDAIYRKKMTKAEYARKVGLTNFKICRETIYITDEELLNNITCIINSIINNPDIIIINETEGDQDSRLTKIDNDICRKLDTFRFEKKLLRKELFDRIALGYQILNQNCYTAMLMHDEMKCSPKQTSFPLRLFNKYVREVHLETDASVSIMLINHQVIRG